MRLIPPRSTFPNDASAEEMAAMSDHAAYIREMIKQGTILAAGPVQEGEGSWGMGVAETETGGVLESLCKNDPVILAKLGFRWDILPMGSLLHKDAV